jgi:hypothetical protein
MVLSLCCSGAAGNQADLQKSAKSLLFVEMKKLTEWTSGDLVGATGFEPATLRSRIDPQLCPSLPFNNLRRRRYQVLGGVWGVLFRICSLLCSQNQALLFIIIYDNLGFQ